MRVEDICVEDNYKLIITIVKKGLSKIVMKATKESGCEGATIFLGTGSNSKSYLRFLGLDFEPEKEIIFTYVRKDIADSVLDSISYAAKLYKPNTGISFILNIKYLAGICHLLGLKEEI